MPLHTQTMKEVFLNMQVLVSDNLQKCCAELVEFSETGVLPKGIVWDISAKIRPIVGDEAMELVKSTVRNFAVRRVAEDGHP